MEAVALLVHMFSLVKICSLSKSDHFLFILFSMSQYVHHNHETFSCHNCRYISDGTIMAVVAASLSCSLLLMTILIVFYVLRKMDKM